MIRRIIEFSGYLLLLLSAVFAIHFYGFYKGADFNQDLILFAYVINYILAVIIYAVLLILEKKYNHLLGFFFMGGSMLKMAFFFIFFSSYYRADGKITTSEIFAFLVPYGICLIFETTALIKRLNR